LKGNYKGTTAKIKAMYIDRYVCDLEVLNNNNCASQILTNMEYEDFSKIVDGR